MDSLNSIIRAKVLMFLCLKQNVVVEFGAVGRSPAQRIVQYIGMQSPAFVDIRQHQGALFWPSFNSREICTSFLNAIEKLDSWIKHVESTEKNSISTVPKKSKYEHVYAVYNSRAKQRIRWSEEDGASKEEPLISRVHPASLYLLCPENSVDVMITIEELCPSMCLLFVFDRNLCLRLTEFFLFWTLNS